LHHLLCPIHVFSLLDPCQLSADQGENETYHK
jgi:hypothetical protein